MARVKKLTDKEFLELIIDKELEIAKAPIRYKDITAMSMEEQEKFEFYTKYTFKTLEEFLEWKNFFMEHIYDWLPKRTKKSECEREFSWCNLQWGLKYDFNYELIHLYQDKVYRMLEDEFIKFYPTYNRNNLTEDETGKIREILYIFRNEFGVKFMENKLSNEIRNFIEKYENELKNLKYEDEFKLPVILLLLYGLVNKQNFTINNWPLNNKQLKIMLKTLNIFDDVLK